MGDKPWNIYIFTATKTHPGMINVGKTRDDNPYRRIKAQIGGTAIEGRDFRVIEFRQNVPCGDEPIHELMKRHGAIEHPQEWFSNTSSEAAIACIDAVQCKFDSNRTKTFKLYSEQQVIVDGVATLFNNGDLQALLDVTPRTGKTFMAYWIAKLMNWEKVLIITAKPAAGDAWYTTIYEHVDFAGYSISCFDEARQNPDAQFYFASKQWFDYDPDVRIAQANKIGFDGIIWDESHYGKNTDNSQRIIDGINRKHILFLSGTPDEDLKNDVFEPHQIFRYSLLQQQIDKKERQELGISREIEMPTPNIHIPRFLKDLEDENKKLNNARLFTVKKGEFIYKKKIVELLDYFTGYGNSKYPLEAPYCGHSLFESLDNFMIFVDSLDIGDTLIKLIDSHNGFKGFNVVDLTKEDTNGGTNAIDKIKQELGKYPRNIIISCDKAGTGTTIPTLDCVIMLKNLDSAPTYTQYALRCQSPHEGKDVCYIIDLSYRRAIEMVYNIAYMESTYGNLDLYNKNCDFTTYIPVRVIEDEKMIPITGIEIVESVEPPYTAKTFLKNNWQHDKFFNYSLMDVAVPVLRHFILDGKKSYIPGLRTEPGQQKVNELLEQPNEELYKIVAEAGLILDPDKETGSFIWEDADPTPIDDGLPQKTKEKLKTNAEKSLKLKYRNLIKKLKACNGRVPLYLFVTDDCVEDFSKVLEPEIFLDTVGISYQGYNGLITSGVIKNSVYQSVKQFFYHKDKHPEIMSIYYPELSLPLQLIPPTDKPISILLFSEKMDGTTQARTNCPRAEIYYISEDIKYEDAGQKHVIARNARVAKAIPITIEEAKKKHFTYVIGSPRFYNDNNKPIYISSFNLARSLNYDKMICLLPASILTKKPHVANTDTWWKNFKEASDMTEINYFRRGRDIITNGTSSPVIMITFDKNHVGPLTFINMETSLTTTHDNLNNFQIPEGNDIHIKEKIMKLVAQLGSVSPVVMPNNLYGFASNTGKYVLKKDDENPLRLFCNKDRIHYTSINNVILTSAISKEQAEASIYQYKILVPKSMSTRNKRIRSCKLKLAYPGDVCTETFWCLFATDDLEKAKNFLSFMTTKTVEYMTYQKAGRTKDITSTGFDWIPMIDTNRSWSDEDIFELAGFNEFERELILNDMY